MADTRQDSPLTTVIILVTVTLIISLAVTCYDQEQTIRSLRQQLSQGCEGRK